MARMSALAMVLCMMMAYNVYATGIGSDGLAAEEEAVVMLSLSGTTGSFNITGGYIPMTIPVSTALGNYFGATVSGSMTVPNTPYDYRSAVASDSTTKVTGYYYNGIGGTGSNTNSGVFSASVSPFPTTLTYYKADGEYKVTNNYLYGSGSGNLSIQ